MKRRNHRSAIAGLFAALCATSVAITASSASGTANEATCAGPQGDADTGGTAAAALTAHNAERARLNLPPLAWNCRLEHEAGQWAESLSQRGTLEHASADVRKGSGENLWMGTAGHWSVEAMVGRFIEERAHYQHGRFPEVSRTGNWTDVGHYSQIVWRDTREVGCAVVQGADKEVLVCRYFPAGNIMGRSAY
jgi:hypothetical protein